MADVRLTWNPNDSSEAVTGYKVYRDAALIGSPVVPEYTDLAVAAGTHVYEVSAQNIWGEGPKSDPVSTPGAPSKVGGVTISISVNVTVAP